MNVLIVLGKFPSLTENFIYNQVISLLENNHKVYILSVYGRSNVPVSELISKNNLKDLVIYQQKSSSKFTNYRTFLKWVFKVGKFPKFLSNPLKYYNQEVLLLENEIDIIHCHFGDVAVNFIEKYLSKDHFKKAKKLITFHGYDINKKDEINLNRKRYKSLNKYINCLTSNTPYLESVIHQTLPNLEIPVHILPVGISETFLNTFYKPNEKEENSIVFVGRLIELKGVKLLPLIAEELHKRAVPFKMHVVGDGSLLPYLKEQVQLLNLQDKLIVHGAKVQEDVFEILNKAAVFLLPGIKDDQGNVETQGLVLQEAQFFDLPVVISDAGGMKYGILENKSGFIVQESDIEGFVEKLIFLLNDKDLRMKMGSKGREFVNENYTSQPIYEKLIKIYNSI